MDYFNFRQGYWVHRATLDVRIWQGQQVSAENNGIVASFHLIWHGLPAVLGWLQFLVWVVL